MLGDGGGEGETPYNVAAGLCVGIRRGCSCVSRALLVVGGFFFGWLADRLVDDVSVLRVLGVAERGLPRNCVKASSPSQVEGDFFG